MDWGTKRDITIIINIHKFFNKQAGKNQKIFLQNSEKHNTYGYVLGRLGDGNLCSMILMQHSSLKIQRVSVQGYQRLLVFVDLRRSSEAKSLIYTRYIRLDYDICASSTNVPCHFLTVIILVCVRHFYPDSH